MIGSEDHGMSQRGGSVMTHLKIGDFDSPLVKKGSADILLSLEKNEAYKTLHYLKPSINGQEGASVLSMPQIQLYEPANQGVPEGKRD